jgi:hypothetical protein
MLPRIFSSVVLLALVCLGISACTTSGNSGGATQNAAPAGGGY